MRSIPNKNSGEVQMPGAAQGISSVWFWRGYLDCRKSAQTANCHSEKSREPSAISTVRPFSVRQRWINARKNIWVSFRNKEAFNFFFGVKSSTLFFTLKFPHAFAGQFAQSIPSHSRIQHHRAMDHASIDCPTPKDLREFSKKLGCVSPLPYYFWLKSYGSYWVTQIIHPFEENATKIIGTFSDHPKNPFVKPVPLSTGSKQCWMFKTNR